MTTKATDRPLPARSSLYEEDFQAWAFEQALLIRERRFAEIDNAQLAEEIEDMGREQAHALRSALALAITHLLKLRYSPAEAPRRHWEEELTAQRAQIESRLETSPSLTAKLPELYAQAWRSARRIALISLKRDGVTRLPDQCSFSAEEVQNFDFWPEPQRADSQDGG
jgi:hypothetical protein